MIASIPYYLNKERSTLDSQKRKKREWFLVHHLYTVLYICKLRLSIFKYFSYHHCASKVRLENISSFILGKGKERTERKGNTKGKINKNKETSKRRKSRERNFLHFHIILWSFKRQICVSWHSSICSHPIAENLSYLNLVFSDIIPNRYFIETGNRWVATDCQKRQKH